MGMRTTRKVLRLDTLYLSFHAPNRLACTRTVIYANRGHSYVVTHSLQGWPLSRDERARRRGQGNFPWPREQGLMRSFDPSSLAAGMRQLKGRAT